MRGSTAGLTVSGKGKSPAHYALLSILDSSFAMFILSPVVVGYWRAIWELMSIYVYPDDPFSSALVSVIFGFSGHIIAGLYQNNFEQWLDPDKRRLTYLIGSRLYTIIYACACANTWRGIWLLLDTYMESEFMLYTSLIVSVVALLLLRCTRNLLAVPFCIVNDSVKGYFEIPTFYRVPSCQRNRPAYILDCLFSVFIIGTLVVFVWRGGWVLCDIYLYPDDEGASAIGSVILGYIVTILAFFIQPLMKWICGKTTGLLKICIADIYLLFAFIGTVNVWRGIWNVLNLYYLPDDPELSCWSTHTIFLILLILLKCSNSVLVRGVYLDAEEPDGKCVVFPCYYLRLYFQNERIKKHCVQLQSLRRKSDISCGDFTKIKPMQHETTAHLCTCHMTNESVTNHITVNIPLMNPIKECSINDNHDAPL